MPVQVGKGMRIEAIIAMVLGLTILISGGSVLFGGAETLRLVSKVGGIVLWFNVLLGAVYVAVGLCPFIVHMPRSVAYEPRTIAAMSLRTAFWNGMAIATRPVLQRWG